MPGRPRTPTVLKVLRGNPGKRPLPKAEPRPAVGCEPPASVLADPVLLQEWQRHAPRLTRLGVLTEIDDDALAAMCVLQVKFRDMLEDERASPAALVNVSRELRALWARFGMTPADRSKVEVKGQDAAENDWA